MAAVLTRLVARGIADLAGRRVALGVDGVALAVAMSSLGLSTAVHHVYAALFLASVASSLANVAVIAYVSDRDASAVLQNEGGRSP